MNDAGEAKGQRQIQEWMGREEKAVAELLECVSVLEPRLGAVLITPITAGEGEPKDQVALVELAERLRASTASIVAATDQIRSILNRLEL